MNRRAYNIEYSLLAVALFGTAAPVLAGEGHRDVSFCGSGMAPREAIQECTDLIYNWVLKEQLPTDPKLASNYNDRGASGYYWRAQSYLEIGQNGRAIADYSECIRLSKMVSRPTMLVTALIGRAAAYFNAGLYELAIADYNEIIAQDREIRLHV